MSWGGNITIPKGTHVDTARVMVQSMTMTGQDGLKEAENAAEGAKYAAIALLEKKVVGLTFDHEIYVSISGHANADHKPTGNWSNDYCQVNVSQVIKP
jgi:hypothetical protein